jgi:methylmalonyl-CoA mutase cobalamin-binding subunit
LTGSAASKAKDQICFQHHKGVTVSFVRRLEQIGIRAVFPPGTPVSEMEGKIRKLAESCGQQP